MIAILQGIIGEKLGPAVIVNVQGVGYGVLMPLEDYTTLMAGDEAKLYVYEHIRDNAHDLYGFTKLPTKKLFEQLLEVTGVGPKMALSILGVSSADSLKQAIATGDTKFVQTAPGVGKRVAERVIVELKDKVGLVSTADSDSLFVGSAQAEQDEAVQGLIALGYSVSDALKALDGIDKKLATEDRIRQALKGNKS